ncbi:DUF2752 domain-containing protein [Allofournierella massiliensis]|uniref:DUF2752 domain-containing protein n=1 Tax=Allofournierella massiliensis TaxID=1650663 RepID=A0ABT7USI1_9FIRM|nr:DUF2752 domain-containing protein [Fournierella massiliensis]MDM8201837.1 DUF2752 domain-containing protein [Fournierella massiliensis]
MRIKAGIARLGLCPRRVQSALILAGVGALYALETQTLGLFVPCPLHLLTGLKCPACGITTAILALLHGDVGAAFAANLGLAFSLPVLGPYLCWLLWGWLRQRPARGRAVNAVGVGLIVYFAVWGVWRNLAPLMGLV